MPDFAEIITGEEEDFPRQAGEALASVVSMEIDIVSSHQELTPLQNNGNFPVHIMLTEVDRAEFINLFTDTEGEEVPDELYSEWEKLHDLLNQEIEEVNVYYQETSFSEGSKFNDDNIDNIINIIEVNKSGGSMTASMDVLINNREYNGNIVVDFIKLESGWKISTIEIELVGEKEIYLTVEPQEVELLTGENLQLEVIVEPEGAELSFSSEDEEVAVVDETGLIAAVDIGETVITVTATAEGFKEVQQEVEVKVVEEDLVSLTVNQIGEGEVYYWDPDLGEWGNWVEISETCEILFPRNTSVTLLGWDECDDWLFCCFDGIECGNLDVVRKEVFMNEDKEITATFVDVSNTGQAEFSKVSIDGRSHSIAIGQVSLGDELSSMSRDPGLHDYERDIVFWEQNSGYNIGSYFSVHELLEEDGGYTEAEKNVSFNISSKSFQIEQEAKVKNNSGSAYVRTPSQHNISYIVEISNPGLQSFILEISEDETAELSAEGQTSYGFNIPDPGSYGPVHGRDASGAERRIKFEDEKVWEVPAGYEHLWFTACSSLRINQTRGSGIQEMMSSRVFVDHRVKIK